MIGGGVIKASQKGSIERKMEKVIPRGTNWIKSSVSSIDPDSNQLTTSDGDRFNYDMLVVTSGVQLRWDLIEGAREALDDESSTVGSIYEKESAEKVSRLREGFGGGKAIFVLPQMPVKCGGAPQKIMYLCEETWKKKNLDSNINFYTSVGNLFPNCPKYAAALKPIAKQKEINVHF